MKKWEKLGTFSDVDDEWEWEVSTPDEMGDKQKLLPPSWPTAVIPAIGQKSAPTDIMTSPLSPV